MSDLTKNTLLVVLSFLLLIGGVLHMKNIIQPSEPSVVNVIPKNDTIYIRGLGKYQEPDLEFASKTIKDFYGYPCKIIESVGTTKNMYSDNQSLDDYKTLTILKSNNTTLYITDEFVKQDSQELRGSSLMSTNNIIVRGDTSFMKSTIIHELGHLLYLEHCDDLTCVMALNNDEYDSGDFCMKCKKIIGWSNI